MAGTAGAPGTAGQKGSTGDPGLEGERGKQVSTVLMLILTCVCLKHPK